MQIDDMVIAFFFVGENLCPDITDIHISVFQLFFRLKNSLFAVNAAGIDHNEGCEPFVGQLFIPRPTDLPKSVERALIDRNIEEHIPLIRAIG